MVIFIVLCLILALVLGGSYYAYYISFYSPQRRKNYTPSFKSQRYDPYRKDMARIYDQLQARPFETVTAVSHDGLTLTGRYYHVKDNAPLDIAFHGYRSSPMTDFSGGAELSHQLGHNLLLVDHRAHGTSGGHTIAFGIQERWDVVSWIDFALERFGSGTQIYLYGISMGATTVLMASELELPENVKAIIADCPYSSPKDIIQCVAKSIGYPPALIWPFVRLGAKLYGGFDIRETSAAKAAERASVPILILHGEEDGFVPCEMSRQISQANPERIQYVTFPGADHGFSYLHDMPGYRNVVIEFINNIQ